MTEIEIFNFEGSEVRVVTQDGDPWWVVSDVCLEIGLSNVARALSRVDALDITTSKVENTRGHMVDTKLVNESGLYDLILDSRKPEAKRFRRWITSEVLPTIRKTGGAYIAPGSQAEIDLTNPDTALDKLIEIAQVAKEARARNAELEAKAALDAPKVMLAEEFFESDGLMGYRETARGFGIRQSDLMTLLREWGWVERNSIAAKAYAIQQGYAKNLVYVHTQGQNLNGKLTRKGVERAAIKIHRATA